MQEIAEEKNDHEIIIKSFDLLDRQPFVDQLIAIANALADKKKNVCYAINGGWGIGKTYVLDMFEKQIGIYGQEDTTLDKFLVFHYNCWQYDYYDEPLIAIVSAIMNAIDEGCCILPEKTKQYILATLKEVALTLLDEFNWLVKKKTGINIKKYVKILRNIKNNTQDRIDKDHGFDTYFDFKKKLAKLKEAISSLSKEQTVLVVVDELDRCLPEYAIKVMERLHHLFDDIPNLQLILSVDKKQLENTVSQIYGKDTRVDMYLAKFIDFEILLDAGTVQDNFDRRFVSYVQNFDIIWNETKAIEIEQFVSRLLEGLGIRQRIAIIEKSQLIHGLISPDGKMDKTVMCIELFLVLLKHCGLHEENARKRFDITNLFPDEMNATHPILDKTTEGMKTISEWYRRSQFSASQGKYFVKNADVDGCNISCTDIWGCIIATYRSILGFEKKKDHLVTNRKAVYEMREYADKFWKLLQVIN